MAKQVRMMMASSDVAPLIDRGIDVDIEIKNLTVEDKGIKARIGEAAGSAIQEGETGIRLCGTTAAAVVSAVEKYELNANAEKFPAVQKAVEQGLLIGIVEKTQQLAVPPADIEKAAEILKKAGIHALVGEGFAISGEEFRKMATSEVSSIEQGNARQALRDCVSKSVSYRVKYEKYENKG